MLGEDRKMRCHPKLHTVFLQIESSNVPGKGPLFTGYYQLLAMTVFKMCDLVSFWLRE